MYGKIFESIYEGSLYGDWKAIVTLQQLIVIADEHGIVDKTPEAIAGRTSLPLEIINEGLAALSAPDKRSRSDLHKGRRIILSDDERDWGWEIVNYKYYRDLASRVDKQAKDKERIRRKRAKSSGFEGDIIGEECAYCGDLASGVDHIVPLSKGGADNKNNVVPCCQKCNSSKGNRDLLTFLNDDNTVNRQVIKNKVFESQALMRLVAFCSETQLFVADVAYTDTDTDTKNNSRFDEFWNSYPRKEGSKKKAKVTFDNLSKKKQELAITDPSSRYSETEKKYVPYPTTYLNGEYWEQEAEEELKWK